jgi:hypothetical protein
MQRYKLRLAIFCCIFGYSLLCPTFCLSKEIGEQLQLSLRDKNNAVSQERLGLLLENLNDRIINIHTLLQNIKVTGYSIAENLLRDTHAQNDTLLLLILLCLIKNDPLIDDIAVRALRPKIIIHNTAEQKSKLCINDIVITDDANIIIIKDASETKTYPTKDFWIIRSRPINNKEAFRRIGRAFVFLLDRYTRETTSPTSKAKRATAIMSPTSQKKDEEIISPRHNTTRHRAFSITHSNNFSAYELDEIAYMKEKPENKLNKAVTFLKMISQKNREKDDSWYLVAALLALAININDLELINKITHTIFNYSEQHRSLFMMYKIAFTDKQHRDLHKILLDHVLLRSNEIYGATLKEILTRYANRPDGLLGFFSNRLSIIGDTCIAIIFCRYCTENDKKRPDRRYADQDYIKDLIMEYDNDKETQYALFMAALKTTCLTYSNYHLYAFTHCYYWATGMMMRISNARPFIAVLFLISLYSVYNFFDTITKPFFKDIPFNATNATNVTGY